MNVIRMIEKKRNGESLRSEEIRWIIENVVADRIPDYQISALLMAIYFRGLDLEELLALTEAMIQSGNTIDLKSISEIKVDKHSTGGVGDKVSLILAPLVASAGVPVPMMAGRALGHTGGTLDKLEAIPGFRTTLTENEFRKQIEAVGCAIMGQTEWIVPADRKLYALRDVTGTVPSIPLICSSIMSKKKAEGTDGLILDVKFGKGAFLKSQKETLQLARELVKLGNRLCMKTEALMTDMDQPLGRAVGNWVETREAIESLKGNGPPDLMEVVLALGSLMLVLGGKVKSTQEGLKRLELHLSSGEGYNRFLDMVRMQGGDLGLIENPRLYPSVQCEIIVKSPVSGFVSGINALKIGHLAMDMGGGRIQIEDSIDPAAGIVFHCKVGDSVEKGEPLATLLTNKRDEVEAFMNRLLDSYTYSQAKPKKTNLIDILINKDGENPFYTE